MPSVIEQILIEFHIGAVALARPALARLASVHVTTAPSRLKRKSAPARKSQVCSDRYS